MRWLAGLLPLIVVVLVMAQPPEPRYQPADAVRLAAQDVVMLPPGRRMYARYLSLYWLPSTERSAYVNCVAFLVNSLSREKILTRPVIVPGSDNTLLRIDLDDYGISPKVWDQLIGQGSGPVTSRSPEPYFYARIEKTVDVYEERKNVYSQRVPAGTDPYRRPLSKLQSWETVEKVKVGSKQEIRQATAPWIAADGGRAIASLVAMTQSPTPIVRADWWIAYASWAPGYYDLLGLGTKIADFNKLVFADSKLAALARSQVKGVVTFSPVALHNRALLRMPTVATTLGGYYWESHDTAKSVDERDYVNVLLDERFDATEVIASLPNGLQAYYLTDAQGGRLDVAVAGIAQDHETTLQDHQVFAARNCITCHSSGIRPISDEVRTLSRDKIALLVVDPKQARRIADLYFSHDLSNVVQHDQQVFQGAVRQVNGLTGPANGAVFEKIVHGYLDQPLTPEMVVAEVGVTVDRLKAVLQNSVGMDHTLTGLLQQPPRPLRRDQFEKSFGQLMTLLGNKP